MTAAVYQWLRVLAARNWLTVQETVLKSKVLVKDDGSSMDFKPEVFYQYRVGEPINSRCRKRIKFRITNKKSLEHDVQGFHGFIS